MFRPRLTLSRLIAFSASAYFALWACAPPSVVAPMGPSMPGDVELGGAVSGGVNRHENAVYDPVSERSLVVSHNYAAGGLQFWPVVRLGRVDLGASVGVEGVFGRGGGLHAGGLVRPRLFESDTLLVGLEFQLGLLYLSGGVPLSVKLADKLWFYTSPSFGFRMTSPIHLPVGLSLDLNDQTRLTADLNWWVRDSLLDLGYLEGNTVLLSVGFGHSF